MIHLVHEPHMSMRGLDRVAKSEIETRMLCSSMLEAVCWITLHLRSSESRLSFLFVARSSRWNQSRVCYLPSRYKLGYRV